MEFDNQEEIISYLTFQIGEELYAANVSKVQNILEVPRITRVPKSPAYMLGVINLRGSVLPVIDARVRFGIADAKISTQSKVLVLDIEAENEMVMVGALVDSVHEVIDIEKTEIHDPPTLGLKFKTSYLQGVYKKKEGHFMMILDMDKVFSTDDITVNHGELI
jgi:purine-binding chemotaxis protein CheW